MLGRLAVSSLCCACVSGALILLHRKQRAPAAAHAETLLTAAAEYHSSSYRNT